ncbi:hypothetical protein [Planctomyces sp. SH-PL14]|uniref:hypothetical protein n=1 Tax=Planctomyces sp. SH-PL14 TaxID=1632864 RepID=UPI00078E7A84|nr:hypothetical protein [Planctomyces sp. SH-PL14]AMV19580.1 hypothetical protein VT03_16920 [Planctomyces sp. SH-PL14]
MNNPAERHDVDRRCKVVLKGGLLSIPLEAFATLRTVARDLELTAGELPPSLRHGARELAAVGLLADGDGAFHITDLGRRVADAVPMGQSEDVVMFDVRQFGL